MENRARVCEQCGTQYPPNIVRCPQDGEITIAATTALVPAGRSAAVLLGSFFAHDDLDSRATSALTATPNQIEEIDDFIIEEDRAEEANATRRALKAVDYAGQRKSVVSVYESDIDTSFLPERSIEGATIPAERRSTRGTLPPVLDQVETALLPKPKKGSSLVLEPNMAPTSRASAVTDPEIRPTSRASAATDPEIGSLPSKKTSALVAPVPIDRGESAAMTVIHLKKPGSESGERQSKKKSATTEKNIATKDPTPKSSKATLADVGPKGSTAALRPVDPEAIDNWKISAKPALSSKVLKSVPLALSGRRPSVTPKYVGLVLLASLLCGVIYGLWSLLDHTAEKKEQLINQAPVIERVELSLRSNPSGARISGSINGEPFSPRFSPNSLTVTKGATVEVTFEYANYTASSDRFVADSSREISVHLALAPVSQPQPMATADPKPVTTVSTKNTKPAIKNTSKTTKTTPNKTTKITPFNSSTDGKKNPLPAKPEL